MAERLERFNVPYTRVVDNTLVRDLLSWVVPALVFVGLWFFVIRRFAEKQGRLLDLPTGMLPNASPVSEDTQRRIDDAIRAIVMGGFEHATAILGVNRDVLERSARALRQKETLDETAIRSLTANLRRE